MGRRILFLKFVIVPLLVLMGGAAFYLIFSSPRMRVQPHIQAFQVPMTPPPPGTLTVQPPGGLPSAEEAVLLANPLASDPTNLMRGKVYYGYYCQFCHGADGAGDGPVGQSYVPRPKDLSTAHVRAFSDGQLLRAMLTGTGHEPVLERVIPPEHRWYLELYVRALARTLGN